MTRSIFDPNGGQTERSGSTFLGPHAENVSHLPPDVTDGEVGAEESAEAGAADRADEMPDMPATDSAEVARRLGQMTGSAPGAETPLDEAPLDEMPPARGD